MIGLWVAVLMAVQSPRCRCPERINWTEIDRAIALAAMRTDLELILKRNREAFEKGER